MKTKITILCTVFLFCLSFSVNAENKKKNKKEVVTFDVSMTCEKCKKRIEKNIAFEKGVSDMYVDLPSKTVSIEYRGDKTDQTKLKSALEKLGYTVTVHQVEKEADSN